MPVVAGCIVIYENKIISLTFRFLQHEIWQLHENVKLNAENF